MNYRVTRGPEVYIDRIEISGNTKTRDKVIRRELELQEQQRFSGTQLRRSQDRLRRLGFFEDVNITTRKAESEDRLDVIVDVREGSTGAFSAGAGISSGESFLFNVRLSETNLFGRGQAVVLNADFGSIRRNISLSFTEPYFLDTPLTLGIDAFNWQLEFDEFTRGGTGGGIRLLYPFPALGLDVIRFGPLGQVSLLDTRIGLEYRIEDADISNVSRGAAAPIQAEAGSSLTSSIMPRIFRDTRNNLLDPTNGSFQDLSVEIAGLGGDSKFINAQSRARWYYPFLNIPALGAPIVFATGWTFGYGFGYGDQIGAAAVRALLPRRHQLGARLPGAVARPAATWSCSRWRAPTISARSDRRRAGAERVRGAVPARRHRRQPAADLQQRDHLPDPRQPRRQGRRLLRCRQCLPGLGRHPASTRCAYRSAAASAGCRRSARCASRSVSRSTRRPATTSSACSFPLAARREKKTRGGVPMRLSKTLALVAAAAALPPAPPGPPPS